MDAKRLRRATTALAVAALLTAPPWARAQDCAPGQTVATLDQYCEGLPTSDGAPLSTNEIGRTDSGPKLATALPGREVAQLSHAGPAAEALLALPALSPLGRGVPAAERRRIMLAARQVVRSGKLDESGGEAGRVVGSSLRSAGGAALGGAFRWGLVACTLGFVAMAWLRFRTRLTL